MAALLLSERSERMAMSPKQSGELACDWVIDWDRSLSAMLPESASGAGGAPWVEEVRMGRGGIVSWSVKISSGMTFKYSRRVSGPDGEVIVTEFSGDVAVNGTNLRFVERRDSSLRMVFDGRLDGEWLVVCDAHPEFIAGPRADLFFRRSPV
jgi:hypothetical protein